MDFGLESPPFRRGQVVAVEGRRWGICATAGTASARHRNPSLSFGLKGDRCRSPHSKGKVDKHGHISVRVGPELHQELWKHYSQMVDSKSGKLSCFGLNLQGSTCFTESDESDIH